MRNEQETPRTLEITRYEKVIFLMCQEFLPKVFLNWCDTFSHLFVSPISSGPTTAKHSHPFQGCSLIWEGGVDDSPCMPWEICVTLLSICLCLSVPELKHTCFVYVHMGEVESLSEHESGT